MDVRNDREYPHHTEFARMKSFEVKVASVNVEMGDDGLAYVGTGTGRIFPKGFQDEVSKSSPHSY